MSASETDSLLPKHAPRSMGSFASSQDNGTRRSKSQRRRRSSNDNENDLANVRGPDSTLSTEDDLHRNVDYLQPDDFYELIGMKKPNPHGKTPSNLEAAHGFYSLMCQKKHKVQKKYRFYDILIIFLLVLQLILSGVFVILGALNLDHHIAIAVLGAISSVVAGVLALMRGQGLPSRLRTERDALGTIILRADEMYWDVGAGREVTYNDVKKLRDWYSAVLEAAGKNRPDMWNPTTIAAGQGVTKRDTLARRSISGAASN